MCSSVSFLHWNMKRNLPHFHQERAVFHPKYITCIRRNRQYILYIRFIHIYMIFEVIFRTPLKQFAREREQSDANFPYQNVQRHSVTSLETALSLANGPSWGREGWGRSMYSAFPGNCSVSYLSFVYGKSLWAELNGGENSLHWKANMLPLFSIMTLWRNHWNNFFLSIIPSFRHINYYASSSEKRCLLSLLVMYI